VGVPRGTLLARLLPSADPRWAEVVEKALVARGAYVVAGEEARIPGREELAGAERELSARVEEAFVRRRLDPPSVGEVAQEIGHKQKVVEGLAAYLVKKGSLLRLPGGWLIAREPVEEVITRLRGSGRESFDVGEFKEMFGLTRRLAIPLLEHLDAAKVTRRVGERRQILPPSLSPPRTGPG
jgi:selenocysteine-specific elongation factor